MKYPMRIPVRDEISFNFNFNNTHLNYVHSTSIETV